jgi:hypothetical protein
MTTPEASAAPSPSALISQRIAELGGWRGAVLSQVRRLILEVDAEVVEEWKWMGTPVWSCSGILCTGEAYKGTQGRSQVPLSPSGGLTQSGRSGGAGRDKVKLTFAKGAFLEDPARLFNASLEGNLRRAIDLHEGAALDEAAFKALVRRAIALNRAGKAKKGKIPKPAVSGSPSQRG